MFPSESHRKYFIAAVVTISRLSATNSFHLLHLHKTTNPFCEGSTPKSSYLSMSSLSGNLVSVEDCIEAHNSEKDNPVFLDASWYLSPDQNGRDDYEAGPRIDGAKFFDIDDVCAKGEMNPKGLPHMMPPKKLFEQAMDAIGVKLSDHVVIYGKEGCMCTARAWYQIRAMGHPTDQIHLMQGGLNEWIDKGGRIETGTKKAIACNTFDNSADTVYSGKEASGIVSMEEVLSVVEDGDNADSIIVDARSAARFRAQAPEPRKGVRGGHFPGSYNVPVTELIDSNDSTKIRFPEDLKHVFKSAGVDLNTDKNIICSCGSGVMASLVAFALEECGRDPSKTFVYDGSWTEWGSDPNSPIDT